MLVDLDTVRWLLPELILVAAATCVYVGGTWIRHSILWAIVAMLACVVAAGALASASPPVRGNSELGSASVSLAGPLVVDGLGQGCRWGALLLGLLVTLASAQALPKSVASEYLGTLLLVVAGVMLSGQANELVFLFVSLELVSIPTYVLLFLGRQDRAASESAAKYFFLSILSSALLLYGLSFLYGLTGTTTILGTDAAPGISNSLAQAFETAPGGLGALVSVALVLIFSGLGFKIAAVPFHFYAPDVYQGTSNLNAGLLAVAPKIVGIVALVRAVYVAMFATGDFGWQIALVVAALTMTIGNACALWQKNIRRMMAYSSIAHGGYMLIGLAVALLDRGGGEHGGIAGMLFYLVVYALATLGVFAGLAYVKPGGSQINEITELAGLAKTRPETAAGMAVCLFSLAGIPPLAGFWGKLALFQSAVAVSLTPGGIARTPFAILAVAGALNAAIAAAYYLRIVGVMYFRAPANDAAPAGGVGAWLSLAISAVLVVACGVMPAPVLESTVAAEASLRTTVAQTSPVKIGRAGPDTDQQPVGQSLARDTHTARDN